MANIGMMFDASKVDPAGVSSQLPVSDSNGWPVVITASEMKQTAAKDGDGFLELTLQIIDGDHRGMEGAYRLNIFNKNEKAQEIAHKQLSAICHVTGVMQLTDSSLLHNKPFRAVVVSQTGEGKENFTQVKGVKDINGNDPGKAGSSTAVQPSAPAVPPTPPAANTPTAPWSAPVQPEAPTGQTPWGSAPATGGEVAKPSWAK